MNIFEYILFTIIVLTGMILPIVWCRYTWRLRYLQKMALFNILRRQQKSLEPQFYASYVINQCVNLLYKKHTKKAKRALAQLVGGRVNAAAKELSAHYRLMSLLLLAHENPLQAYRKIYKDKKLLHAKDNQALLRLLAQSVWVCQADGDNCNLSQNRNGIIKAYELFARAFFHLQNADLRQAASNTEKALKKFRYHNYLYEEAQCYLRLADIYRFCCMYDLSFSMLEAAQYIFDKQNLSGQLAQVIAAKGLQMLSEGRYDEAQQYYQSAINTTQNERIKNEILNQYALLEIVRKQYSSARKKLSRSLPFFKQYQNANGVGFSLQLLGQISYEQQHYIAATKQLIKASDEYKKVKNFSACCECFYLIACIYFRKQKYEKAENILHEILQISQKYLHSFHVADVYSLLGLIYMETEKYTLAKEMFEQSLQLELKHNRNDGVAVDYLNLSRVEHKLENYDAATADARLAMEYAQKSDNVELIELIKNKMMI